MRPFVFILMLLASAFMPMVANAEGDVAPTPCPCGNSVVSFKSDMVKDAAVLPNLGIEWRFSKGWSIGVEGTYIRLMRHNANRQWRMESGTLYARKWFGKRSAGRALSGHHAGIYGQVGTWQFAFGKKGHLSGNPGEDLTGRPNWGCGVEYGYSLPVARHFNIDFTLGLGYVGGFYQTYTNQNGIYCWKGTHRLNYWGPTRVEISLVWFLQNPNR